MMGANPDFVCDEHEFSFPEGTDNYCVACGMRKRDFLTIIALNTNLGTIIAECEKPENRGQMTQKQQAEFLDGLRAIALETKEKA